MTYILKLSCKACTPSTVVALEHESVHGCTYCVHDVGMVWNLLKITMFDDHNLYSFLILLNHCKLRSPGNLEILQNCHGLTSTSHVSLLPILSSTTIPIKKKLRQQIWATTVVNTAIMQGLPPPGKYHNL